MRNHSRADTDLHLDLPHPQAPHPRAQPVHIPREATALPVHLRPRGCLLPARAGHRRRAGRKGPHGFQAAQGWEPCHHVSHKPARPPPPHPLPHGFTRSPWVCGRHLHTQCLGSFEGVPLFGRNGAQEKRSSPHSGGAPSTATPKTGGREQAYLLTKKKRTLLTLKFG